MNQTLPVVYVHGIRLSGACWRQQARLLPDRVVASPDLPGHGGKRAERFTVDAAVSAVSEAIDQVGGSAILVGHSLGGYVASAVAARRPDQVAFLVGIGFSLRPGPVMRGLFRSADRGLRMAPDGGASLSARALRRVLPPEVADPIIAGGIATEVIPDVMDEAMRIDPLGDIACYRGNVLLLNGRHDHFRLGERQFLAACQNGALQVVPGAGHYLPLTHGPECARIIDGVARYAETAC